MSNPNFTIKKRFNFNRDEHQRNNYLDFAKQTILDKNTDVLIYPFNSSEWFNYVVPYLFRQENKSLRVGDVKREFCETTKQSGRRWCNFHNGPI